MDDFGKQFADFVKKTEATMKRLPLLAANTAKNFFQDSFRRQAWIDSGTEPWKRRRPGSKRNKGRAILTDTGRLKRGVRVKRADWVMVNVQNNVPYAEAHNDGFRGSVNVRSHRRKVKKRNIGTGKKKVASGVGFVNSHNRKMNLPKRQFMGNSVAMNRLINRQFIIELKRI